MTEKIINYIKKHKTAVTAICAAIVLTAFLAVIILVSGGDEPDEKHERASWGNNSITENIPEFQGELASLDTNSDSYTAAYYSNVSGEKVSEYISELEAQLNVKFNGEKYPRTAVYGDKIIVIHYNVTEMRLSVTVTEKYQDNSLSGDTENEN